MGPGRRFSAVLAALSLLMVVIGSAAPVAVAAKGSGPSMVGRAASYHLSRPAREVAQSQPAQSQSRPAPARRNPLADEPDQGSRGTRDRGPVPADPLSGRTGAKSVAPPPFLSFAGTGNPVACGGCLPPDTVGDVGPSHYIQMVNVTKVAIYDKAGVALAVPFDLGTLWPAGDCTGNDGDPVVIYDQLADRWLLSQFQTPSNDLCFAISTTADPTGTYHLFEFGTGEFPDYFKVGVGPDAYYVGANEPLAPSPSYTQYAFDRSKMLAGDVTAGFVKFTGQTNFTLPGDLDGATGYVGTAGYFYTYKDNTFHGGVDRLEVFALDPDFVTPAASTFTALPAIPISAFTYTACGFFNVDCIRQPLPATEAMRLDQVGEWPMHRFVYRNFGTHETLLGTFNIGAALNGPGGTGEVGAAIRWFELRKVGAGAWTLFQEGTYDPADGHDRWMASIAMDGAGNIALGFSVSSLTQLPSIRYATRAPGDPAGTLGPETSLIDGSGYQSSTTSRWGDYSAMSIDPSDDCTFWYTNEYYPVTSASTWSTRIGAFRPACGPPSLAINDVTLAEGNAGTTAFTFTVTRSGDTSGSSTVDYRTNDGSATAPSDYTAIGTTPLTFAATETTKTVTVNVNGDTTVELNETFTVDLSNPVGATIADAQGLGTINNDDTAPPSLAINDVTLAEGNAGTTAFTFTVTRSGDLSGASSVDVATADGSATTPSDYTAITTTTVTFAATETTKTVTVNVNGDLTVESTEIFLVNLTNPVGATITAPHGVGTITNDDSTPPPVRKPDGRIRKGSGAFVGNNIYNTTGVNQTKTGSAARRSTITFGISIQNDGNSANSFKVLATGSASTMYNVRYFRGTTEITAAVVAGTYTTPSLAPGATYLITAKVKVKSSATVGSSVTRLVTIRSVGDTAQKDAVKLIGKRA